MDDQLLREFLAEADERIEVLFRDIERLRRVHGEADGRARRELIARIFRHVHTLKGSAATLPRLAPVSRLAHEFENLLDAVRGGRAPLTEASIDTCEDATNALALTLASVAQGSDGHTRLSGEANLLNDIFQRLRQQAGGAPERSSDQETNQRANPVAALPAEIGRALSAVEGRHLGESVREGARVLLLAASFDLATLDQSFGRFTAALGECGEIISTFPGDPANAPDEIAFRILYTTICPREELETRLAPFGATVAWTGDEPELVDASVTATAEDASTSDANDSHVAASPDASSVAPVAASSRAPVFVRVPLHELDELVTATHELFTDTLAVLEQADVPGVPAATPADETQEEARVRRLREDFGALEERVMSLRMQPLMPVLERAARAARIAARVAGKEIELEVAGGDVRVDRVLAEQIGEPLLHLLRNAVDHGIETAEERRAAGKPPGGRVRLEVAAEGSRVRVRVADDGRGIDTERVARVAVAQGLLEAGAHVTDEHALRLIFRPGFSTAAEISTVSGRGVGLDVVEHALEQAGGELRVRTARGVGTTFELRVPLTLALVPVVVVRAGGYAYACDMSHVIALAYLEPEEIEGDEADSTARWHGEQLPLISLRSLLEGERARTERTRHTLPVVVMRRERDDKHAWQGADAPEKFVVAVDRIEGEREALVRSLGRHATRWRGVGGAFTLRDGTVALLLDLPRLLER
ncbi:MAG TPA: ATP-binding protein [Pyrinomonadaceae bacterium]|jgi:two-component system chemotaxis sensor kinase CheA|nr:ATP-binding protein [Pyrinomonadaceae bacterium]